MINIIAVLVISLILQACGGNAQGYHPSEYAAWHPLYWCEPGDTACRKPQLDNLRVCRAGDSILHWCDDNTLAVSPDDIPPDSWIGIQWINQQGFIGAVCEINPAEYRAGYCADM